MENKTNNKKKEVNLKQKQRQLQDASSSEIVNTNEKEITKIENLIKVEKTRPQRKLNKESWDRVMRQVDTAKDLPEGTLGLLCQLGSVDCCSYYADGMKGIPGDLLNLTISKQLSFHMKRIVVDTYHITSQSPPDVKQWDYHSKESDSRAAVILSKKYEQTSRQYQCKTGIITVAEKYSKYYGQVDPQPQGTLILPTNKYNDLKIKLGKRQMDLKIGFLGFAVNLIHINSNLLPRRLRERLLYPLLGELMIFRTTSELLKFKTDAKHIQLPKLVSLEGYTYSNGEYNFGFEKPPDITFGGLPYHERPGFEELTQKKSDCDNIINKQKENKLELVEIQQNLEELQKEWHQLDVELKAVNEDFLMLKEKKGKY